MYISNVNGMFYFHVEYVKFSSQTDTHIHIHNVEYSVEEGNNMLFHVNHI